MMSRMSTRITSAIERLGSTSPESKQNDVNDKIESHPPPPLNKRVCVEAKERDKKVLVSLQKQVQEVKERHDKQVKDHINKVEKHVHIVDASHKSSHKDDKNNDKDNNDDEDEDDDADDDNNYDDVPEAETLTLTLADVVKVKKRLTARG